MRFHRFARKILYFFFHVIKKLILFFKPILQELISYRGGREYCKKNAAGKLVAFQILYCSIGRIGVFAFNVVTQKSQLITIPFYTILQREVAGVPVTVALHRCT